jgi:hypothetical protein
MVGQHIFIFYLMDVDLAGAYYEVFNELLLEHSPTLYAHLDENSISCGMYLFSWLQTLFLQVTYHRLWHTRNLIHLTDPFI